MKTEHDLHIHTTLSACCKDDQATPENIINRASEQGLTLIGFSDHLWDSLMPGADPWYKPQNVEHVLQIRDRIPQDTGGVKVLVGCESEYHGKDLLGISPESARKFDFVLLPMSHLHMKHYYTDGPLTSARQIADLMVRRFKEVIELGIATGIAHPFLPCGFVEMVDEIIGSISETAFTDCFGRAAELGVGLEITLGFFPGATPAGATEGRHDETYVRMLQLAKSAGSKFYYASDTHTLGGVGGVKKLEPYLGHIGITENDLIGLVR